MSGYIDLIRATIPETIGVAPLVPDHNRYSPPGKAPIKSSAGAVTPIDNPLVEKSLDGIPLRSRPPTDITPGIVAGAETSWVPSALLPAAATTTTSFSNAYKNALSQLTGQETEFLVSERLITFAPLSTAQIIPLAI